MQAASPAFEMARLTKLMGTGSDVLTAFGALLVFFAAFGLFVTQYNAVNDRQYDIALIRALGASKARIFGFILAEVMTLAVIGSVLGIVLASLFLRLAAAWVHVRKHIVLDMPGLGLNEVYVIAAALVISLSAGLIPAIKAYKISIVKILGRV